MPHTVVFLWFSGVLAGPPPTAVPPPRLDDLYDYGAARGVSFVQLEAAATRRPTGLGVSASPPGYDAALVDRLEAELEQARTALSALEEAAAAERLTRVETELLTHPHLPQAAFLMAECLALQAQSAGPGGTALRARRAALEGPRAPAFGEPVLTSEPVVASVSLEIKGPAATDELEVDGQATRTRRLTLTPGLHHLRVLRAGRLMFAAFQQIAAGQSQLTVAVPGVAPCSADDLGKVNRELIVRGGPPAPGVLCAEWAVARSEPGGVGIALCSRSSCGPFVHWQRRAAPAPFAPLTVDRSRLPAWAGFAIAGAGAAIATSVLLWQSGALDRGQRAAGSLRYGGLNP